MNIFASFSYRLRRRLHLFFALLARKWKSNFYLYLAALFTILILVDATFLHLTADMKQVGLDMMVRYRFVVPKPDKDIVIVDIDEASLAEMAKEYGRWPWPRQVLGEFVQQIEKQNPQAIVFDIVFSDPDVFNPASDAEFDAVIATTKNTFFPMLRLSAYDDQLSQLNVAMIPGAFPLNEEVQTDATIAMLMPYFKAVLDSGRLGLNNIHADSDGVTRQYITYADEYGWQIPSLPLRVAQELNFPATETQRVFLNWRGPPFTYNSVSFSKVFKDMGKKVKQRPADEFTGKIVIIGSTASSLFAIRPTPMSRSHPGVEILATAIDNFKHVDYLRFPDTRIIYTLITLLVIWATAWGFYRDSGRDKIDLLFGASQFILIGISYGSINLSNTYINLTGPVTLGLAYFSIARLYTFATGKLLENSAVSKSLQSNVDQQGVCMLIHLGGQGGSLNAGIREKIRLSLIKIGELNKSVEILKSPQKGVWSLFEDTIAISWVCPINDEVAWLKIKQDIELIEQGLLPLLRKHYVISENDIEWLVGDGLILGGEAARVSWRTLFGTTLSNLKLRDIKPGNISVGNIS
jgi:CHASE2 domain-containing sensor protein